MTEKKFDEGDVLFVRFRASGVRLTFGSPASLGIGIVAGENEGFEDPFSYEAVAMFDVSNEIAYANLMVQAKKTTSDNKTLGRSS